MAAPEYAQWVQRGRAHEAGGRAVDALICFRRALRLQPGAPEAHAGVAEALWRLGRVPDAIAAWREAVRLDPQGAAAVIALAEALLATGAAGEARDVAAQVLASAPHDAHAAAIRAVAQLALAETVDIAAAVVAVALERAPALAAHSALTGPLALALDALPAGAGAATVLARVATLPGLPEPALATAPPLLLALALERADELRGVVTAELVAIARSRRYVAADIEPLRRIA
ncbi:MAG: tetratricopeptide repeat protein, partial [Betaproteobacteria bacterium]